MIMMGINQPASSLRLAFFRIAFGLLMFFSTLRFISKGWIDEFYIDPQFHFTYYGFAWVKPLTHEGMYVLFAAMALLSLMIAAGLFYRFSITAFFLLFTYVELIDKTYYLNHYYFVSLLSFLLIFLPLNCRLALDVRLFPWLRKEYVPHWMIGVICFQLGVVYFFAGLAKLNPDWLLRAMPLSIWLPANADFPLLGRFFDYSQTAYLMSWCGAIFDLTIPFWLSWRRSRLIAYLSVVVFHGLTGLLFQIGMFPWIMMVCTLIFFDEQDYRKIFRFMTLPSVTQIQKSSPVMFAGLLLFLTLQCLVPLRHWLYPGNVLWTEEGYRFSWNVMLAEKNGFVTFYVAEPASGKQWIVYPGQYLTPQQEQQMSFQPDMILEFAHFLRDRSQAQGYRNVEVHVEAYVSLNGRASRLLIDPDADLADQPMNLLSKPWIVRA